VSRATARFLLMRFLCLLRLLASCLLRRPFCSFLCLRSLAVRPLPLFLPLAPLTGRASGEVAALPFLSSPVGSALAAAAHLCWAAPEAPPDLAPRGALALDCQRVLGARGTKQKLVLRLSRSCPAVAPRLPGHPSRGAPDPQAGTTKVLLPFLPSSRGRLVIVS